MMKRFWDEKNGGFYFTSKESSDAVPRRKEVYDGALPSGNSVALLNLLRLGLLSGNSGFAEMAGRMSETFAGEIRESPGAHTFFLIGVDFAIGPAYNVTVVGDLDEDSTKSMLAALRGHYLPNLVISLRPPARAGLGFEKIEGKATVYVCRGQTCLPPTNNVEKMLELLGLEGKA